MSKNFEKNITIMVPALDEEANIKSTIVEILSGLKGKVKDYEIFIFDDGSKDKTGEIAEKIAKRNNKIKIIHHKSPRGMGYCYRSGLKNAKFKYYMYIPGDNQFPGKALGKMLDKLGATDIIVPYVLNMNIRPILRQWLSSSFTFIVNSIFSLNIKYFNGTVIHKVNLLKGSLPKTNGHAYQAEILVRLLKSGATYQEIGYNMIERNAGATSAFKFKNVKSVFVCIITLFWEIRIKRTIPVSQNVLKLLAKNNVI